MNSNSANRILVTAVAVVVLVAGLYFWTRGTGATDDDSPASGTTVSIDQRLTRLMNAGETGDVDAWQSCFIDRQPGVDRLTLKKAHADVTGFIHSVPEYSSDRTEASLTLEKSFPEHIESYAVRMRNIDGDWKIVSIAAVKKHAPKVKYGTPVVPPTTTD